MEINMSFDLVNAQSYIPSFDILFEKYPIKRVLEFGEGEGTRYFLEKTSFVCSVEVIVSENHYRWVDKCKESYKAYKEEGKWEQIVIIGGEVLKKVDINCQKGVQTELREYEVHLKDILETSMEFGPYDVAFVDYGIHMRADMVNLLFNKVDIICAHDTGVSPKIYGWDKISPPNNYKRQQFKSEYLGTTFWIKDVV
jgi:hypothetical protein